MNKHARIWLSVQTGFGIGLAGLGHYYASAWREVYPLAGYVYYFLAALAFAFAWRTARSEPNAAPSEFRWSVPATFGGS